MSWNRRWNGIQSRTGWTTLHIYCSACIPFRSPFHAASVVGCSGWHIEHESNQSGRQTIVGSRNDPRPALANRGLDCLDMAFMIFQKHLETHPKWQTLLEGLKQGKGTQEDWLWRRLVTASHICLITAALLPNPALWMLSFSKWDPNFYNHWNE